MMCLLRCHNGEVETAGGFTPCGGCDLGELLAVLAAPAPADHRIVFGLFMELARDAAKADDRHEAEARVNHAISAIVKHYDWSPPAPAPEPVSGDGSGVFSRTGSHG